MHVLILMFPSPSITSLKVEGNLSGSMKMLIIKLGKKKKCHDRYRQTLQGKSYRWVPPKLDFLESMKICPA